MRNRHDMRVLARPNLQLRRPAPIPALNHVARRRCGERKTRARDVRIVCGRRRHLVDDGPRVLVLCELQIGVDHIVLPVQLVAVLLVRLGRAHRRGIGRNRFLPVADAREDVGRHVLRMRRRRRDLGIARGGVETFLGDRRIVVGVDQVVGDAGMLRLALEDPFQDRRRLELVGIGLVGGRGRDVEREGVIDLCLVVLRVMLGDRLHRLEIGLQAGAVVDLVVVGVERGQRSDELVLARRLRADGLGLLKRGKPLLQICRQRRTERVEQQAHRDAPIGDGALRIGLERILENLLRSAIPERVLVAHAAVEAALRGLVA
jgi:hypothetical protein